MNDSKPLQRPAVGPGLERINFGALPMPEGYCVVWDDLTEHYKAIGPHGWETRIVCDRFAARRAAIRHAEEQR